jgi:Tol biopolymer transport system component
MALAFGFLVFLSGGVSAGQKCLTEHRFYWGGGSDGAGKIYISKHESGGNDDLYRMNEDGTGVIRITNDVMDETSGAGFPDRTKITVLKSDESYYYIYTMNSDGSNARELYSTTREIYSLKVSPDGTKIGFIEDETLCVINADGSNARTLAPRRAFASGRSSAAGTGLAPLFVPPSGSTVTQSMVSSSADISFSTDSTQIAFVENNNSNTLSKINTDGTGLTPITTYYAGQPHWLRSNKIVFASNSYVFNGFTYVYTSNLATVNPDGTGYTVLYSSNNGFSLFTSPDETQFALYATGKFVIVSSSGSVVKEFAVPSDYAPTIGWVSNSKFGLRHDVSGLDLYTINSDGTNLTNITNNNRETGWGLLDAKGDKILYTNEYSGTQNTLYTMNTDGSGKVSILTSTNPFNGDSGNSFQSLHANLSPDGSKLAYAVMGGAYTGFGWAYNSTIYGVSSSGGTPYKIVESTLSSISFQWSPDGNKISYELGNQFYLINSDGSGKKEITFSDFSSISSLLFSPDSSKIMFLGFKTSTYSVCTPPIDLSAYTVVFATNVSLNPVDWKSNKVLLEGSQIYVINSDGSSLITISTANTGDYFASLSPDGSKVEYFVTGGSACIVNSDGTGSKAYVPINGFAWAGDSQKVAYTVSSANGDFEKVYLANADGTNAYNLNTSVHYLAGSIKFVSGSKVAYDGDSDIWSGDYSPSISVPVSVAVPTAQGEVKVVIPEGGGTKGTINPDSGKPVSIGFKGNQSGQFTLRIFTQFGEQIYEETKDVTSSDGWFEWIPKGIASGVYMVHVEGPGCKIFKKIAILR